MLSFEGKKYYPYMDGFRAIAVFWVMSHHIFYFFDTHKLFGQIYGFLFVLFSINAMGFLQLFERFLSNLAHCGNMGVDMFFVISGFLITGLLLDHLEAKKSFKRFYVRRFFKIYPQYLLLIIVTSIVYLIIKPNRDVIWSFLFLQNYFPRVNLLSHTWSLVIEEQFYVFYPIVLWGICRLESNEQGRRRLIILLCLSLLAICNFIRFFYPHGIPCLNIFLRSPYPCQTTLFRVDALAMGCLLKLFEDRLNGSDNIWKYLNPFLLILSIVIYWFFFQDKLSVGGHIHDTWFAYTLAYLAPVCLFVTGYRGFTPVKVIVENSLLRFFGRNSYGLYLWHYLLIYPATLLAHHIGPALAVVIYVISATAAGIMTTMTIERYFLKLREIIAP